MNPFSGGTSSVSKILMPALMAQHITHVDALLCPEPREFDWNDYVTLMRGLNCETFILLSADETQNETRQGGYRLMTLPPNKHLKVGTIELHHLPRQAHSLATRPFTVSLRSQQSHTNAHFLITEKLPHDTLDALQKNPHQKFSIIQLGNANLTQAGLKFLNQHPEAQLIYPTKKFLLNNAKEKNEVFVQQEGVYIYEVKSQP